LDEIFPHQTVADNKVKNKLIDSGLSLPEIEVSLKKIRAEAEVFTPLNVDLAGEEAKLGMEFDKIMGSQTVNWEGDEITLSRLAQQYQNDDRAIREKAWRLDMARRHQDRAAMNELWGRFLANRLQQADNLGLEQDYRAMLWKQKHRFDYDANDCKSFHAAIEQVVVPAAERIYEKRRKRLGLDTLRPWDLDASFPGDTPLKPFDDVAVMNERAKRILHNVDPELGEMYLTMDREGLLDLDNRKNKAPGGYCTEFAVVQRPFIFMNAVGSHRDVQTLLHEAGHAFHVFESAHLPYLIQGNYGSEVAEVASMSMELLSAPYFEESKGGYYSTRDAARARIEHLEKLILFWPYMAVVDAFQHWVYENPSLAADAANCDAAWTKEWNRFMKGVDWSGLEDIAATGWHRKLHIFQVPLYYVEYGLAQLGAIQVWSNSLTDPAKATRQYRDALALGGTASIPDFFRTAGAKFAFDAGTVGAAVKLCEDTIAELETTL
ncbi:MAG: M3 family oligoendopeptidase, partial [Armatimonadetes bacterium]|nr:M3 family oligoendopeptidase [Armatimonadota bacterium]